MLRTEIGNECRTLCTACVWGGAKNDVIVPGFVAEGPSRGRDRKFDNCSPDGARFHAVMRPQAVVEAQNISYTGLQIVIVIVIIRGIVIRVLLRSYVFLVSLRDPIGGDYPSIPDNELDLRHLL